MKRIRFTLLCLALLTSGPALRAQPFVHPGGLHTLADLNRMKTNVLAGNHPWIDDWNVLITDSEAQSNYTDHATADLGANRQNADADAHAAYLNTIEWYISGNTNFANAAAKICNDWSADVNQVPSNTGLVGLPIMSFALVGELLRTWTNWSSSPNFTAYTNMMLTYLYPSCTNYILGASCPFDHWTSWDGPNNAAIMGIAVLCDDTNKYNLAVTNFMSGYGTEAISNAVPYLYPGPLGQCDESGRDQEHCSLGIADLGVLCQVAWNQGLDLFGFANNRLLAGVEYLAQYNLSHNVPYNAFNDCEGDNLFYVSNNGRGRIDDRPIYEMFYNHYAVQQGLSAPNTKAMAQLYRPDHGSADHFGYQTLTFTLNANTAPYPPAPLPDPPTGLTAQAGISQVTLNWMPASGDLAQGCSVLRSTASGGPYANIATWTANTFPSYTDTGLTNGTTYYYVVSALNQSGSSANSAEISATPAAAALPAGWTSQDVGVVASNGSAVYTSAGDNTFIVTGYGTGIGGTGDGGFNYTWVNATNNFTLVARLTANHADQMGLMMRASLATNAALAQFFMAGNARESTFGVRTGTGANLNHYTSGDQFTTPPAWYKLQRTNNNVFNAYQSADGVTWIMVQSATVTMGSTYYAGLAINSGNAIFDNVVYTNAAVTGTFAPPAAPASLAATAVASNQVYLTWSGVTNAGGYNIKRSTISGGGYTGIASNVPAAAWCDPTAAANSTYYYVVSALNGGGESTNSIPAGVATPNPSVPAAPIGLTAAPGTSQIALNWSATIGAASYNVYRSTNYGGPYARIATGVVATFADTGVTTNTWYFYVVRAVNGVGEGASSAQVTAALGNKLAGTVLGTSGSWGNLGNTIANVFDGNLNTFFDGPDATGDWVGLDFGAGTSNMVGLIQFCPRANYASRMLGGIFQGANNPSFTNPVILATVAATPASGVMTPQTVTVTNSFRYVRYLGPANANCNVAEIQFDGGAPVPAPPPAPASLSATPGDAQVVLHWNAVSDAAGYSVESSTTNGGAYGVIASNLTSLVYTNTGLVNGTAYYYAVAAVNAGGASTNSTPASAIPVSLAPPQLNWGVNGNQLQLTWPADHLGWTLQMQTNLLYASQGSNWITVPNSTNATQLSIPVAITNSSVFYRLMHP